MFPLSSRTILRGLVQGKYDITYRERSSIPQEDLIYNNDGYETNILINDMKQLQLIFIFIVFP